MNDNSTTPLGRFLGLHKPWGRMSFGISSWVETTKKKVHILDSLSFCAFFEASDPEEGSCGKMGVE